MEFRSDRDGFEAPYAKAIDDVEAALIAVGERVLGAADRGDRAKRDRDDLLEWGRRLEETIRDRCFIDLPRLRRGFRRIPHFHHLTVGAWRGIFLVSKEADTAVGLIFSKAPHDYEDRLLVLVLNDPQAVVADAKRDDPDDAAEEDER